MTKLHFVKKSRKDFPGIPKGSPYHWWQFAFGPKRRSMERPRRSQYLTQSDFLCQLYDIEDDMQALGADDGLADAVTGFADQIRTLGEEQTEKRGNMPVGLQDADAGVTLEERATACEEMAMELEGIDFDVPEFEHEEGEGGPDENDEKLNSDGYTEEEFIQNFWDEKLGEVQAVEFQGG